MLATLTLQPTAKQASEKAEVAGPSQNLAELLEQAASVDGRPGKGDIAVMNLVCAEALRGAEDLNVEGCLTMLDQWAQQVRVETERHFYRFRADPREFDQSEGYFRMLMMAVVLAEDFGVRYNPARMSTPGQAEQNDGFFSDARDVFLHGLLGPRRLGTCSSMPVLYLALGRRLGYPLKLVTTKAHLFLRWESETERFNLEATGRGMNRYDDEHYKHWPFPLTEQEIAENRYLKSLTPAEELAVFLTIRSQCLKEAGRRSEAVDALAQAVRLAPHVKVYRLLLAEVAAENAPHDRVGADVRRLESNSAFRVPNSEFGAEDRLLTSAPTPRHGDAETLRKPAASQADDPSVQARVEVDRVRWQLDAARAAQMGSGPEPNPRLQLR